MSKKRPNDEMLTDETDEEFDKIFDLRKIQKCSKDEIIGFCDCCQKMRAVKIDKEQPQFSYCVDCEIDNLAFEAEFLEITPPELKRTDTKK